MGRPKGLPKTGGRRKGTPNKAVTQVQDVVRQAAPGVGPVVSLRELAQRYTDQAMAVLVSILEDPTAYQNVRIMAAREVLDRGYGKPFQAITGEGGGPIAVATKVIHEYHTIAELKAAEAAHNLTTAQVIDVQPVSRLTESTLSDTKE